MTENEIAKIVVYGAYHIHRRLGLGLLPIDCRFSAPLRETFSVAVCPG